MKLIDTIACWCNPATSKKKCGRKSEETPHDYVKRRIYLKRPVGHYQFDDIVNAHFPPPPSEGDLIAPYGEKLPKPTLDIVRRVGSDGTRHWVDLEAPRWGIARITRATKRAGLYTKVPE